MDTRPVSGLLGAAAYRPFLPGNGSALVRYPPPAAAEPVDVVELSPEARDLARQFAQPFPRDAYWDQVRYDPPHTDDPDFPWEVAHQEWMQLVDRVFRRDGSGGRPGQPGKPGEGQPSPRT
ncbi:MAG: hypothetical protein KatS3mg063_2145 [Tepidiforma sp.]|uniref:Uncharacterized protein n=1 Tax=Tepidiforma bonchosmolovskayae TaxID=2601677 RepID=A0ABX6BZ74_9CHLR|nr:MULTISPECIES: hypothetical protein [Tepidiforma]QFG02297.1 hypothetical protein Tbon_02985 [Tepidiforma bonchosmolovskayae]GIW16292.1 MAG: hypothetical protein KatS3mg063_2145 [Tepidiforma sp.]